MVHDDLKHSESSDRRALPSLRGAHSCGLQTPCTKPPLLVDRPPTLVGVVVPRGWKGAGPLALWIPGCQLDQLSRRQYPLGRGVTVAAPLGSATRRWLPLYLQQGIRKVVWVRTNRLTDASLQACHFVWLRLNAGPTPGGTSLASSRPRVALPRLVRPRTRRTRKSHQFYAGNSWKDDHVPLAPVAGFGLRDRALPMGVQHSTTGSAKPIST